MASIPQVAFTDEQMFEWLSTKLQVECVIGPQTYDLTLQFTPFPDPALKWMENHLKYTKKNHRKTLDNIILIPFIMRQSAGQNGDNRDSRFGKNNIKWKHILNYQRYTNAETIKELFPGNSYRTSSIYKRRPQLWSVLLSKEDNRLRFLPTLSELDEHESAKYSPSMYTISYYNGDQYLSFPLYHKDGFYNTKNTVAKRGSWIYNHTARNDAHQIRFKPGWRHLPLESAKKGFYTLHNFLDMYEENPLRNTNQHYTIRNFVSLTTHHKQVFSVGFIVAFGEAFYEMRNFSKNYSKTPIIEGDKTFSALKEAGYPIVIPSNVISLMGKQEYSEELEDWVKNSYPESINIK